MHKYRETLVPGRKSATACISVLRLCSQVAPARLFLASALRLRTASISLLISALRLPISASMFDLHLVGGAISCREHHYREVFVTKSQPFEHVKAVNPREHQVENDEVWRVVPRRGQGLWTGGCRVYPIPFIREPSTNDVRDGWVIVNYQNALHSLL